MGDVSVQQIRDALNGIEEDAIPDATIETQITFAELSVEDQGGDPEEEKRFEQAVIHTAAYHAFTSSPPMVRKRAIANLESQWDQTEFISHLEKRMERAQELAGASTGGSSAAFTDSASSLGQW